jgi:hypothetical protein
MLRHGPKNSQRFSDLPGDVQEKVVRDAHADLDREYHSQQRAQQRAWAPECRYFISLAFLANLLAIEYNLPPEVAWKIILEWDALHPGGVDLSAGEEEIKKALKVAHFHYMLPRQPGDRYQEPGQRGCRLRAGNNPRPEPRPEPIRAGSCFQSLPEDLQKKALCDAFNSMYKLLEWRNLTASRIARHLCVTFDLPPQRARKIVADWDACNPGEVDPNLTMDDLRQEMESAYHSTTPRRGSGLEKLKFEAFLRAPRRKLTPEEDAALDHILGLDRPGNAPPVEHVYDTLTADEQKAEIAAATDSLNRMLGSRLKLNSGSVAELLCTDHDLPPEVAWQILSGRASQHTDRFPDGVVPDEFREKMERAYRYAAQKRRGMRVVSRTNEAKRMEAIAAEVNAAEMANFNRFPCTSFRWLSLRHKAQRNPWLFEVRCRKRACPGCRGWLNSREITNAELRFSTTEQAGSQLLQLDCPKERWRGLHDAIRRGDGDYYRVQLADGSCRVWTDAKLICSWAAVATPVTAADAITFLRSRLELCDGNGRPTATSHGWRLPRKEEGCKEFERLDKDVAGDKITMEFIEDLARHTGSKAHHHPPENPSGLYRLMVEFKRTDGWTPAAMATWRCCVQAQEIIPDITLVETIGGRPLCSSTTARDDFIDDDRDSWTPFDP